jgi:ribonuclease HII
VEEIEQLNILQATMLSMRRAIANLKQDYDLILVDGNSNPLPGQSNVKTVIGGDKLDINISAASIIAKAARDQLMADLHQQYTMYNWQRNSGYGTLEHREAIRQYGSTEHHRKLFLRNIVEHRE